MKKILCAFLSAALLATSALPAFATETTDSTGKELVPEEGTYAPNQVVVLFKSSAIDTNTVPKKGNIESVGADFGDMSEATSSEKEALGAADEEASILRSVLGSDFTIEDTLVFNEPEENSKAGTGVGAADDVSEDFSVALVSSDKYDTAEMIEKLSKSKTVETVEPNYYIYQTGLTDYSLNDPLNRYNYAVNSPAANNTGGDNVSSQGVDPESAVSINASSGWAKAVDTQKEIVVAVVDTGILYTHEELKDKMWTNPGNIGLRGTYGYDFNNNDDDPIDDNNHGTHCSGIITAQANNEKGIAGVASDANIKLMSLKIFNSEGASASSTIFHVVGAYNYIHKAAQGGVNVVAVNNSWGGGNTSTIFDKLLDLTGEDGIISYIAASNEGDDNDRTRVSPSNTESEYAVTVGAADIEGDRASFSNYGKTTVDVFGPGVAVLSSVAKDIYEPAFYDARTLNATTEYYGEFNSDTEIVDGTVTPSTGSKAGENIKSFGSLKFGKWQYLSDDDHVIPDDASLELAVENNRLKITVKNAHYGEAYLVYFPYEKNPLTAGDDNTSFSILSEGIPSSDGSITNAFAGEIVKKDGVYKFSKKSVYAASNDPGKGHSPYNATNSGTECFLSAEESEGIDVGFGIAITGSWTDKDESHDASFYIDSIAISKPDYELEPGTSYNFLSGTSMATPAVCGAGTLLTTIYPRQENESGGDYAKRIRAKLLSCVRQTEKLKDLCSTGGYIDLSLLDEGVPAICDAVCNLENETLTLKGENLYPGSTLTYRRLAVDGAEDQTLPEEMTAEFSADGKTVVISNAKSLFSTYTEFTVTAENGMKGSGKFFLVKGQNKLGLVNEDVNLHGTAVPYLLTDADGRNLYGYYNSTREVSYYDGEQFSKYKNTNLSGAFRKYFADRGDDAYTVYNSYLVVTFKSDVPAYDNGVIYNIVIAYIPDESKEAVDNGDGEDEEDYFPYREEHFLATFDLNGGDHLWHFTPLAPLPEGLNYGVHNYSMVTAIYNDKLLLIGDPGTAGATDSTLPVYSYDAETESWTQLPDLPYVSENYDIRQSNGKLYVMFGFDPDREKSNEERVLSSVWSFDGEKWEQTRDDLKYVGRINDNNGTLYHSDAITSVKNGLVFTGAAVDGGGNMFLYNTETDEIEPLYHTSPLYDSIPDSYDEVHSCAVTRDGIYYLCKYTEKNEEISGWRLYLLPESSGLYESPFEDVILGDADGDGKVSIKDVTAVQRHIAEYENVANEKAADVNGDGVISIDDATIIQRYLAEMDVPVGIGQPV